jgi:hypothetical protein
VTQQEFWQRIYRHTKGIGKAIAQIGAHLCGIAAAILAYKNGEAE